MRTVSRRPAGHAGRRAPLQIGSDVLFAVALSAVWLFFYNTRFWQETFSAMWRPAPASALFIVSLGVLVLYAQALLLLLVPTRRGLRVVASLLFIVAAASSHFTSRYGVVFDQDMVRNVAQTDPAEAGDLLSLALVLRVLLLGVVPAVLVWFVRIPERPWHRQLGQRVAFIAGGAVVAVGLALLTSASYASFLREHKPVRAMLSPGAAVWSSAAYLASQSSSSHDVQRVDPGGPPQRMAMLRPAGSQRPMVVVLVVGETARAANFQLGGYGRPTNPELSARRDLFYFPHVTSCGTATAASVPCMFSHLGRADFRAADAKRYSNLLDLVQGAGVAVQWRDNNSGCKGVCARVPTLELSATCQGGPCFDDVLVDGLPAQLAALKTDSLIVLHQAGSHGPAYFERVPEGRKAFGPACNDIDLSRCGTDEIVAAYDNTIHYTDHVLARLIGTLQAAPVDALMIYVSDHGESLGENGIYLHGMPYAFAPPEQREVPMLVWMSEGYGRLRGIDSRCLSAATGQAASHDNLFHTVMGAVGVTNGSYQPELDLVSRCSRPAPVLARRSAGQTGRSSTRGTRSTDRGT